MIFSADYFLFCLCSALLCKKLVSLIRSHPFVFVFIVIAPGGGSNKILLWFMSEGVLLMFSSKSFIVSSLTFRSLIPFIYCEFIFVYGVREGSNFILLHTVVQFSQHHLLKWQWKTAFSPLYSCLLCHRLDDHRCMDLSMDFLSYSTDLISLYRWNIPQHNSFLVLQTCFSGSSVSFAINCLHVDFP